MYLVQYAQLFDFFGFEFLREVIVSYKNDAPTLRNNQDKIDEWYFRTSRQAKRDLRPLLVLWRMPLSQQAIKRVEALNLKLWLPDDLVTKAVPELIKAISDKFNVKPEKKPENIKVETNKNSPK